MIQINIGELPSPILQTKNRSLKLEPDEQYTPWLAIEAIEKAKAVEAARKPGDDAWEKIGGNEVVVSSITDDILRGTNNLRMLRNIRAACPKARVMLTTEHIPQALTFYEAGADFVYLPRLHSAPQIARILKQGLEEGFDKIRAEEIEHLSQRREVLA